MKHGTILILLSSLMLACTPGKVSSPSPSPTPEAPSNLSPWRISLSTSGGVSGGGNGVEIWSDGSVFSIELMPGGRPATPIYKGKLPQKQIDSLIELLNTATSVNLRNYSNMSTTLSWQAFDNSFRHDWVWQMSDPNLPASLEDLEKSVGSLGTLEPGRIPNLSLGEFRSDRGFAALMIGQGQTFKLTLAGSRPDAENLEISVSGTTPLGQLSDLQGQNLVSEDKLTTIKVEKVSTGWVEGRLEHDGKTGTFHLPTWVTVAP